MQTNRLEGRVIVITGAGRGIGREYALLAARSGARVLVNDLGATLHGDASTESPAEEVVSLIKSEGGEAIANHGDVSDYDAMGKMIGQAIEKWGRLDVLINNAGILQDRMLVNMTPEEWDKTIRVHMRGHFCTTRHAAAYWREQAKANGKSDRVLISTSSVSALHGAVGQTNYASAKSAMATFAQLCHRELFENYGVRSYAIAPGARTRLTSSTPHANKTVNVERAADSFDKSDPSNVAPFVMWLAAQGCPVPSGSVFGVSGDKVDVYRTWDIAATITAGGHRWTFEELDGNAEKFIEAVPPLPKTIVEMAQAAKKQ